MSTKNKTYKITFLVTFEDNLNLEGTFKIEEPNTRLAMAAATYNVEAYITEKSPQGQLKRYRLSVEEVSA